MVIVVALLLSGCSIETMAARSLGGALSGSSEVFASDDDPDLVAQALPFALKTYEALLQQDPENADLLLATCSGFTQYSQAFVELEGERLRFEDLSQSRHLRHRSLNLYVRARDYCLRALDVAQPGFASHLRRQPREALASFGKEHVSLLFWTGASWGSAISVGRHRLDLLIDLDVVRAIFERALELNADFDRGALQEAMISLAAVPAAMGGSFERGHEHYLRALELSGDTRAGTHVAWARQSSIVRQDRAEFESTLRKALAVDVNKAPANRLANKINQRFARHLLDNIDQYFFKDTEIEDIDFDSKDDTATESQEDSLENTP